MLCSPLLLIAQINSTGNTRRHSAALPNLEVTTSHVTPAWASPIRCPDRDVGEVLCGCRTSGG